MTLLDLDHYREAIALDRSFTPAALPAEPQQFTGLTRRALRLLAQEPSAGPLELTPERIEDLSPKEALRALRALLNLRPPITLPPEAETAVDTLLSGRSQLLEHTDPLDLPTIRSGTPLALWQGDLTTLAADAVVNAANSTMLGCFQPLHACVDNAIHSAAGPRMREDCATIMTAQGAPEPTGTAKITRAYHLPARYVLHTVGPIVHGPVTAGHRRALADSYTACLDLAAEIAPIRTIAFCAISTGVFGYPRHEAARTALQAIEAWLEHHPGRLDRVICCTYTQDDTAAYRQALQQETP
jgi:O-acetyl-ADP-ribose deacetylase (regulator of RNase III)